MAGRTMQCLYQQEMSMLGQRRLQDVFTAQPAPEKQPVRTHSTKKVGVEPGAMGAKPDVINALIVRRQQRRPVDVAGIREYVPKVPSPHSIIEMNAELVCTAMTYTIGDEPPVARHRKQIKRRTLAKTTGGKNAHLLGASKPAQIERGHLFAWRLPEDHDVAITTDNALRRIEAGQRHELAGQNRQGGLMAKQTPRVALFSRDEGGRCRRGQPLKPAIQIMNGHAMNDLNQPIAMRRRWRGKSSRGQARRADTGCEQVQDSPLQGSHGKPRCFRCAPLNSLTAEEEAKLATTQQVPSCHVQIFSRIWPSADR